MKEIIVTQEFIEETLENQELINMSIDSNGFEELTSSYFAVDFLNK